MNGVGSYTGQTDRHTDRQTLNFIYKKKDEERWLEDLRKRISSLREWLPNFHLSIEGWSFCYADFPAICAIGELKLEPYYFKQGFVYL